MNKTNEQKVIDKIAREIEQEMITTLPELTDTQKEIINISATITTRILTEYIDNHFSNLLDWEFPSLIRYHADKVREVLREH